MLKTGNHFVIQNPREAIRVELSWDFFGEAVDLDATIVMIDDVGNIMDAVYYNKLKSDCGSITHSGDHRDGQKEGPDEQILIDLSKVNFSVSYLCVLINSYQGQGFKLVETAFAKIRQNETSLVNIMLGQMMKSSENAVLVGFIYRKNGKWIVYNATVFGEGKVFSECEDLIKSNLKHVGFNEHMLLDSKKWSADTGKKF